MVNWNIDPSDIDLILLTDPNVDDSLKICIIEGFVDAGAAFTGGIGTRIGSIFVILITSGLTSLLPILSKEFHFKIPLYFYLFARYFGSGVIIATAFVHLMDPAYGEIGPNTCVGGWGNWAVYSWPPALMLAAIFSIFIIELISEVYVDRKFGRINTAEPNVEELLTGVNKGHTHEENVPHLNCDREAQLDSVASKDKEKIQFDSESIESELVTSSFEKQIAAFLILEFGVIFHSVIIGLNLGSCGYDEFKTLYIVLIFHQSFEGLGIGARLSAIEFPKKHYYWKYVLCILYGLVTPISIAIGLGVRNSYVSGGFTASVVSGVLDSLSAGILIYTGLVELLARDFVFNETIKDDLVKLTFNLFCTCLGCGIMALIGKWA